MAGWSSTIPICVSHTADELKAELEGGIARRKPPDFSPARVFRERK